MSKQPESLSYSYTFVFGEGSYLTVKAELDPQTLLVKNDEAQSLPEWTQLDFHKCPHCPLKKSDTPFCPAARHISAVTSRFRQYLSITRVGVIVETPERRCEKEVDLQKGLSSLMGIFMAGSGCPHTDFLRPLLKFHLPFANRQETFYRVLSMYLLAQYMRGDMILDADGATKHLSEKYKALRLVNKSIRERIKAAESEEANANALMILDCFALDASFRIDQDLFTDLEKVFGVYR